MQTDNDFINRMYDGYIDAITFTECTPDNPEFEDVDYSDSMLGMCKHNCTVFYNANKALLRESGQSPEQCGHDFWLTRNGHGAGFWDRGLGDIGEMLTTACKVWQPVHVFLSDNFPAVIECES